MAKCLVIDDSEVICFITKRIIEQLGHEAVWARNVKDAITLCQSEQPVLVMLDWDLPGLAALDFLKQASVFEADQRPEIVLCATENDPQQFALAKVAGAQYHILKPFDVNSVRDVFVEAGLAEPLNEAITTPAQTA